MILEMQKTLTTTNSTLGNDEIKSYINTLQKSIKLIDNKIKAYKVKKETSSSGSIPFEDEIPDSSLAA